MKLTPILAATLAALSTLSADAALVTWDAPQTITGDSDVRTNGTRVWAFNFGPNGVQGTTINGVVFEGLGLGVDGITTSTALPLSSSYLALLNSALLIPADTVRGLTLVPPLTIGDTYEIQFWVNNSGRTFSGDRGDFPTLITDGLVNDVSLYPGDNGIGTGPGNTNLAPVLGQYVIGTFTADATSQEFQLFSGEVPGVVNGFQIRNITSVAVPEPGTALAGLALVGLCGTMRRRRGAQG